MKGLMIIGHNIEDGEAILTRDLLLRAGLEIDLVSIYHDDRNIKTAYGLNINADYAHNQVMLGHYDFLVIPGGSWVFDQLEKNSKEIVSRLALDYYKKGKLVAAICAAPMFLGKAGILDNKNFTCFPNCEKDIKGTYLKNEKVVVVDNIITGKAVGAAFEFSCQIIKYLLNEDKAKEVFKSTHYI